MTKPCIICRVADVHRRYASNGWNVLECNRCGLVYCDLSEQMRQELVQVSEDEGADRSSERYIYEIYESMHDFWISYFDGLLQQIEVYQSPARLLDVGCGVGYLVKAAQNRGWEAYGLEISPEQVRYAREKLGLTAFSCLLEDASFAEGSFDVVTMHSVIEHVEEPRHLLNHVAKILRPGGLLMIETPNQDSLISIVTDWVYRLTFGRVLLPIYSAHHIFRFSTRTMEALLRSTGFEVLQIRSYDNLQISARRVLFWKRWRWFWHVGLWTMYQIARLLGLENHLLVYAHRP